MQDQQKIDILEWVVGSGSPDAGKRAEALTEVSPEAREYAEEIRLLRDALADDTRLDQSEAESLAQRLRERAGYGLRRRSRPVWLRPRPLGIAAAVLLVIFGGVWFFMPRDIPPRGEILYPREGAGSVPYEEISPVVAGEEIVIHKNRGILTFDDGSRFILRSGTHLTIGQEPTVLCTLERGSADVRAAGGTIKWREVSIDLHDAVLGILISPGAINCSVYQGEVQIRIGSQSWTVSAGNAALWVEERMEISPIPADRPLSDKTLQILEWGY